MIIQPPGPPAPKPVKWATHCPSRSGKAWKYYDNLGHAKNSLYHNKGTLWELIGDEWVLRLDAATVEPLVVQANWAQKFDPYTGEPKPPIWTTDWNGALRLALEKIKETKI